MNKRSRVVLLTNSYYNELRVYNGTKRRPDVGNEIKESVKFVQYFMNQYPLISFIIKVKLD